MNKEKKLAKLERKLQKLRDLPPPETGLEMAARDIKRENLLHKMWYLEHDEDEER